MKKSIALIFTGLTIAAAISQTVNFNSFINTPNNVVTLSGHSNSYQNNDGNIKGFVNRFINSNQLFDGITISQAVKSNEAINKKALEITAGAKNDLQKAKDIYLWIADNITYSKSEANKVTSNKTVAASKLGAIGTFENRSGICLGYASLYTAMARANGLQVREIYGQGFTGKKWEGHMWNQVYIPSLAKWINVDSTFANAFFKAEKNVGVQYNPMGVLNNGNYIYVAENGQQWIIQSQDYFNSPNFFSTHKGAKIVGQWS